jgi:hypothetical protein
MRNVKFAVLVLATMLLSLAAAPGWTQTNVATGQIFGTCADPDGAATPGVIIQVKNRDTGFSRGTVSDGSGFFRIDLVPSGTYDVRADLRGFKSELKRGVEVTLGSAVKVEFQLVLSAVEQEIVVTARSAVIETTNPSVADRVGATEIANLPLNGRDFTDFILLTPAAVAPGDDAVTGRGGVNLGARAIQNSFNIDGSNDQSSFFGEERGGTRPPFTFSQSAIKEMQVIRNSYNLQFSAGGGVINAITKSGTNQFHGEVFSYFRNDSMVSADAFDRDPDGFEQWQYGFSMGGPIIKDRLHWFAGVDAQDLGRPSFRGFEDFPVDQTDEWEAITGLELGEEVGDIGQTNDALVLMVKFDWQLDNRNLLTVRDNWSSQEGLNLTNDFFTSGRSTNGFEENSFNSLVAAMNSVLSDRSFNELIVQYSLEERPRTANNDALPETQISFFYDAVYGQNQFLPNFLDEKRLQIIDNFTFYAGRHTLKAGLNLDLVNFDDGFPRYAAGSFIYPDWDAFFDDAPAQYTQSFSDYDFQVDFSTDYYAAFIQDEWRVSPDFTLTYGLRYQLQKNGQPKETNPLYPDTGAIPNDTNNWAPRAGFAWDISGDGTSVLRGGGGVFYDSTPTLLAANAMLTNGVRVVRFFLSCDEFACPDYPNTLETPPDLPPDIFVFASNFENPRTLRFSLGYERELAPDLAVGVDLVWSETDSLQRKQDQNLAPDGGMTEDGRPTYSHGAVYPDLNKIIQFTSDAEGDYRSAVLFVRKRFSGSWLLDASYTYSRAEDNDSNERSVSTNSSYPEDQFHLAENWGPSDFDIRHKFVASFTCQLPLNFLVSAIGHIRSGFPYSALDERDNNTDTYETDRALYQDGGNWVHAARNTYRQPSNKRLDLRLSWAASISSRYSLELILDLFNITNEGNLYSSGSRQVLVESGGSFNDRFGELNRAGEPRNFQLGARFRF